MLDTADPPPVTDLEPAAPVTASPGALATTRTAPAGDSTDPAGVTPAASHRAATLDAAPVLPATMRLGIFGVALAAAVLSFASLRSLAITTGTTWFIAWLFPIALDAAAVVSMAVWMRSGDQRVATYAGRLTWASVVISVSCNGVQHGLTASGEQPLSVVIAIVVGSIPPIMFGAVVHLVVLTGGRHRWGGTGHVDLDVTPAPRNTARDEQRDETPLPAPEPVTPDVAHDETDEDDDLSHAPVTAELHSVPSPACDDDPFTGDDEQRKCANPACQKLLPRDSHPSRKTCGPPCRQAVVRHRKQEVSA